jgi:hypothetical protein
MNEPVIKNAAATAIALVVVTQVAWFLHYFDVYDIDSDLALQIAQAFGLLVGIVLLVQGWFVRNRVTPTAEVALTKDDVQLLEAATDPQTPIGMGLLRDAAQIARDRVPPTH